MAAEAVTRSRFFLFPLPAAGAGERGFLARCAVGGETRNGIGLNDHRQDGPFKSLPVN